MYLLTYFFRNGIIVTYFFCNGIIVTYLFQGVWHIPNREVDRPGSFAFHMSRSVTLLMQVLKETNDGRMLMQLSMQLGKIPESDKYILDKIYILPSIHAFINNTFSSEIV